MSVARLALRDSLRLDLTRATPWAGLVRAVPVAVLFASALVAGNARVALTTGIGANLLATMSLVGSTRVRIRLLAVDVVGLGLATFVGSATASNTALHILLLCAWCFGAGMLVLFGIGPATAGVQSIIAFVVFGRFIDSPLGALELGGLVAGGAAIECGTLLALHLPPTLRFQQAELASAFEQLCLLATEQDLSARLRSAERLDAAAAAVNFPAIFARSDARTMRALIDEGRRIRLELISLSTLRARLRTEVPAELADATDEARVVAAAALAAIRNAIGSRAAFAELPDVIARFGAAVTLVATLAAKTPTEAAPLGGSYAEHLQALAGQLRSATRLLGAAPTEPDGPATSRRARAPRGARSAFHANLTMVKSSLNPRASAMRHAIRLAVAVPGALLVADALDLPRGYWVAFSVAVVLKPDYSSLFRRGLARGVGTILGATAAALIIGGLQPDRVVLIGLVAFCAWAGYSLWQASFAVSIAFITALVLVLLSTTQANPLSTATDRLLDTVIGGAIALGIYVLWPTWSTTDAYEALSALVRAQSEYLDAVLQSVQGLGDSRLTLPDRARKARLAWAGAEASIGRSMDEPANHRLDLDFASGVLAAARRVIESTHSLRVASERGITVERLQALEALRVAFRGALERVADELSTSREHDPFVLRTMFEQASEALGAAHAPASIALELDALVDSINTLDALVEHRGITA